MADNLIPFSPEPAGNLPARNFAPSFDYSRSPLLPEAEAAAASAPLSHYLWILRRRWWQIVLFVAIAASSTYAISSRLVPVYESTATVDIDRQMPSAIIGQEATRTMLNDSDQFRWRGSSVFPISRLHLLVRTVRLPLRMHP
jgi:hypothetical protein